MSQGHTQLNPHGRLKSPGDSPGCSEAQVALHDSVGCSYRMGKGTGEDPGPRSCSVHGACGPALALVAAHAYRHGRTYTLLRNVIACVCLG